MPRPLRRRRFTPMEKAAVNALRDSEPLSHGEWVSYASYHPDQSGVWRAYQRHARANEEALPEDHHWRDHGGEGG